MFSKLISVFNQKKQFNKQITFVIGQYYQILCQAQNSTLQTALSHCRLHLIVQKNKQFVQSNKPGLVDKKYTFIYTI